MGWLGAYYEWDLSTLCVVIKKPNRKEGSQWIRKPHKARKKNEKHMFKTIVLEVKLLLQIFIDILNLQRNF